jgi:hypothetical protein
MQRVVKAAGTGPWVIAEMMQSVTVTSSDMLRELLMVSVQRDRSSRCEPSSSAKKLNTPSCVALISTKPRKLNDCGDKGREDGEESPVH